MRDECPTRALVGGNCNNSFLCGAFALNLNNTASNTNWNNGTALTYPFMVYSFNGHSSRNLLVKINSKKLWLVDIGNIENDREDKKNEEL